MLTTDLYRYHSIHAVLAQAQMRRGNYSEALYYWDILLSEIDNSDKRIDVCIGVATCCSHLQQWEQGLEVAHKALRQCRSRQKSSHKSSEKIAKIKKIISVLERRQDLSSLE